jgi:ATP-dependent DNA ligase
MGDPEEKSPRKRRGFASGREEFGFEGIVAKRKDSVYESGKRTGAWVIQGST